MVEGARVEPHPRRLQGPRVAHGARQEMLPQALADHPRREAEVGDLDRIILRYAAQLVPADERTTAHGHEERDLGPREVRANLGVAPVPAVAPVVLRAHRAVAVAIQARRGVRDALRDQVGKVPEGPPELVAILELEIGPGRFHVRPRATWRPSIVASILTSMTFNRMGTVPLPLALHLASHTVLGLFCFFAGVMNLVDPVKIPQGILFLLVCGFTWGYVFGILMARREVVVLGYVASAVFLLAGIAGAARFGFDWRLSALLAGIGGYGLVVLSLYRKRILEA